MRFVVYPGTRYWPGSRSSSGPSKPVPNQAGHVLLDTDLGLGLVHTQDVGRVAELIERGQWPEPTELASATLPSRFGFVLSPAEAKQAT